MEEKTKLERIEEKLDLFMSSKEANKKKFRIPFKGKVSNTKLKKGFVTVVEIKENKDVDFRREPIVDSTIKLNGTYHFVNDLDIFTYKGKPLILQPKNKKFPYKQGGKFRCDKKEIIKD